VTRLALLAAAATPPHPHPPNPWANAQEGRARDRPPAPSFDRPDTLKWDGTSYVRYVTHGVRVRFDGTGNHVATVNRLGDSTVFTYNGDTLKTVALPPAGSGQGRPF